MSKYHVVAIKVTDLRGTSSDIPIPRSGAMYRLLYSGETLSEAQEFREKARKSDSVCNLVVTDGVLKLYEGLYGLKRVLLTT